MYSKNFKIKIKIWFLDYNMFLISLNLVIFYYYFNNRIQMLYKQYYFKELFGIFNCIVVFAFFFQNFFRLEFKGVTHKQVITLLHH